MKILQLKYQVMIFESVLPPRLPFSVLYRSYLCDYHLQTDRDTKYSHYLHWRSRIKSDSRCLMEPFSVGRWPSVRPLVRRTAVLLVSDVDMISVCLSPSESW